MNQLLFSVSDFVAVFNQTLEFAYPDVTIVGELANYRISKNRWVYFSLKDEFSSVDFFAVVENLPGPLEDGMMLEVRGTPRLHPKFGFTVNVFSIRVSGVGSIKKAYLLLESHLAKEGLFDTSRKRPLPYPPSKIGLIASHESAAFSDFIKIIGARWPILPIEFTDVLVQGEEASGQIVRAIEQFNLGTYPPDVLVITRGGGSADDLAAFNDERVVRSVAASRIPTLVAIGHERDISLSEKVADQRASTPSNAAELLVPDVRNILSSAHDHLRSLRNVLTNLISREEQQLVQAAAGLQHALTARFEVEVRQLEMAAKALEHFSPKTIQRRGFSLIRNRHGQIVKSAKQLKTGENVKLEFATDKAMAKITSK